MSLFYVAGMLLNDAFDRDIDAKERPERPIPKGLVSASEVFSVGFGMLGGGIGLLYWQAGLPAAVAGAALAGNIVLYDAWHKNNSLSPVLMAGCRVLVYVTSAVAVGAIGLPPLLGSGALFAVPFLETGSAVRLGMVAPLLYFGFFGVVAWALFLVRQKRAIGRAIVLLLAGISLLDALLPRGARARR